MRKQSRTTPRPKKVGSQRQPTEALHKDICIAELDEKTRTRLFKGASRYTLSLGRQDVDREICFAELTDEERARYTTTVKRRTKGPTKNRIRKPVTREA